MYFVTDIKVERAYTSRNQSPPRKKRKLNDSKNEERSILQAIVEKIEHFKDSIELERRDYILSFLLYDTVTSEMNQNDSILFTNTVILESKQLEERYGSFYNVFSMNISETK